jgi:hypothetical protein
MLVSPANAAVAGNKVTKVNAKNNLKNFKASSLLKAILKFYPKKE